MTTEINPKGWLNSTELVVRVLNSPHFEKRAVPLEKSVENGAKEQLPSAVESEVNILIIHCISLPQGEYGTGIVEDLFMGRLKSHADPDIDALKHTKLSCHFLIDRLGTVNQFVSTSDCAWHAGESEWAACQKLNHTSIGIELEGTDTDSFTKAQYQSLGILTKAIMKKYPQIIKGRILGHSEVAPLRKDDPGSGFDWERYILALDKTS